MPKFLVACCACDGSGYRIGIVEALDPKSALMKLGTEIIGHKEDFWKEYMERHDQNTPDWIKYGDSEPIKNRWGYLDREETVFNRWLLAALLGDLDEAKFIVATHDKNGIPHVYLTAQYSEADREEYGDKELLIEAFRLSGDLGELEDLSIEKSEYPFEQVFRVSRESM